VRGSGVGVSRNLPYHKLLEGTESIKSSENVVNAVLLKVCHCMYQSRTVKSISYEYQTEHDPHGYNPVNLKDK